MICSGLKKVTSSRFPVTLALTAFRFTSILSFKELSSEIPIDSSRGDINFVNHFPVFRLRVAEGGYSSAAAVEIAIRAFFNEPDHYATVKIVAVKYTGNAGVISSGYAFNSSNYLSGFLLRGTADRAGRKQGENDVAES